MADYQYTIIGPKMLCADRLWVGRIGYFWAVTRVEMSMQRSSRFSQVVRCMSLSHLVTCATFYVCYRVGQFKRFWNWRLPIGSKLSGETKLSKSSTGIFSDRPHSEFSNRQRSRAQAPPRCHKQLLRPALKL